MNYLFICSRNQWRSPTAECIFKDKDDYHVRSAGTSPKARRTVNANDVLWADKIFVMEYKHRSQLNEKFSHLLGGTSIIVLDIPDDYGYMDAELIELLTASVAPHWIDDQ